MRSPGLLPRGFTLMEILISCAFVGFIILMASQVLSFNSASGKREDLDGQAQLVDAIQLIKRIGRAATSCTRTGSVPVSTLQCTGTFFNGITDFRFLVVSGGLEAQKLEAGNWVSFSSFPSVYSLEVCGDTENAADGAPCGMNGGLLPGFRTPAADPVRANRFFRHRIRAKKNPKVATSAIMEIQSAFYVRNPGDLGPQTVTQIGF